MNVLLPVTLRDVTVRRGRKTLIGPVNFTLQGRGLTVVLGPNGAGKTTLLKALFGLERLTSGDIHWPIPQAQARLRRAYVFQHPVMLRRTVAQNLAYPLQLRGEGDVTKKVEHWADRVGLSPMLGQSATRLSGGEQQKMALARALITAPDLVLLDEPCANLDGRATREIEQILNDAVDHGTRLVMATHDMGQARRLGTEVVFVFKGKVHESGPGEAFFDTPQTSQAKAFLNGDILE